MDSACGVAEACQAYRVLSGRRCGRQGTVLAQQGGGARPVQMDGPLLRDGFGCFPRRRAPATSGRFRRKWAPISPWVLDFWAVSGGGCSPSAPPTWGNAGAGWRSESIRPAKPPRSCKWGLRASEVAHLGVCFSSVGAGRRHRDSLSAMTKLADYGGRRVARRRG